MLSSASTAKHRRLTAAEYLAPEAAADVRHEFLDGEMFAMSGVTFGHYRQVPSLREYVLVAQDRYSVEAFLRQPDGAKPTGPADQWLLSVAADPAAAIHLGSLEISMPLAEIDTDVEFPAAA